MDAIMAAVSLSSRARDKAACAFFWRRSAFVEAVVEVSLPSLMPSDEVSFKALVDASIFILFGVDLSVELPSLSWSRSEMSLAFVFSVDSLVTFVALPLEVAWPPVNVEYEIISVLGGALMFGRPDSTRVEFASISSFSDFFSSFSAGQSLVESIIASSMRLEF